MRFRWLAVEGGRYEHSDTHLAGILHPQTHLGGADVGIENRQDVIDAGLERPRWDDASPFATPIPRPLAPGLNPMYPENLGYGRHSNGLVGSISISQVRALSNRLIGAQ